MMGFAKTLALGALLLVLLATGAHALYDAKSGVVQLTPSNFNKLVTDASAGVALVEFYAPWCGHCKSAAPEVAKAAAALKGVAIVGAVDMTVHESLGQPYGIKGFPTFKIFVGGKPTSYEGPRSASAMVDAVTAAVSKAAKAKLNGGGQQQQKQQQQQQKQQQQRSKSSKGSSGKVVDLTDNDFDTNIAPEDEMFMVAFTAPWCGHCKALYPEWDAAAKQLEGSGITLFNVDATANENLARRFQIKGFPTIKTFRVGKPRGESFAEDYQGPRTAAGIVEYATSTFEADGGQPKGELVQELVTQSIFEETCVEKKKCVIAFLDHLLDTNVKARKAQIEVLTAVAKRSRHIPVVWVSANDQVEFEETYDLRSGFPAVIMLRVGPNNEKLTWVHRGKFTEEALNLFVSAPRGLSTAVQKPWPHVMKTHPWDGESEAVRPRPQEDDGFNLEEFLAS